MSTYLVNGGKKLSGVYEVSGAKNAGPKLLISALLTDQSCSFKNIPDSPDTRKIAEAIEILGGEVEQLDAHSWRITCLDIKQIEIPESAMSARQSVLFIGAMLARMGRVRMPLLGGDVIGKRPIDRLLAGIEALGGEIKQDGVYTYITLARPHEDSHEDQVFAKTWSSGQSRYRFEKNTHTGTESLILAAVFNPSEVLLENCALEPEVDNLIDTLNSMGAKIAREDDRHIRITGVKKLLSGKATKSMYDRLEAATALVLNELAGDTIEVRNIEPQFLTAFTEKLNEFKKNKKVDIVTDVHPGFMTDWQPLMALLAAVVGEGVSTIHERIFEKRWSCLRELGKMGVHYELYRPEDDDPSGYNFNQSEFESTEPHAARIFGPTELKPAELNSHDVRAGIDVLLAALFAKGESVIRDPKDHIARGYEDIVGKLTKLGADIKKL